MNKKNILLDPKTVLGVAGGGFIICLLARPVDDAILTLGGIYVASLSICLMPILITAIYVVLEPKHRNPSGIRIAVRPDAPNRLRCLNTYLSDHVGLLDSTGVIERYRRARARPDQQRSR